MDERHSGEDERAAQEKRADDPPEEHPMLVLRRNGEGAEEQDEDEEVVDRERFLQDVTGEELEPLLAAVLRPEPATEDDREGDPEEAPAHRLAEALFGLPGGDAQIERQEHEHAEDESGPEPEAADVAGAEVGAHLPRPPDPRGVLPLFCRKTSRTGTCSSKRSRSRLSRKRR